MHRGHEAKTRKLRFVSEVIYSGDEKMKVNEKEAYHFDRIHINSKIEPEILNQLLPIAELKKHCKGFEIYKSHPLLLKHKSLMQITAPTFKTIMILLECERLIGDDYIFTKIEIARDIFFGSEGEAERVCYQQYLTIRKKFSNGFVWVQRKKKSHKRWLRDYFVRGLFSDATYYAVDFRQMETDEQEKPQIEGVKVNRLLPDAICDGVYYKDKEEDEKKRAHRRWLKERRKRALLSEATLTEEFRRKKYGQKKKSKPLKSYKLYPRLSKINGRPCVHGEWQINSTTYIKDITGVEKISDLLTFDFEGFFKKMDARYIVHERINLKALGIFLIGYNGRRTLTERQKMYGLGLAAQTFCNHFNVQTYSELVLALKKEILEAKKAVGKKSLWHQRMLGLKNFNRFKVAYTPYNNSSIILFKPSFYCIYR